MPFRELRERYHGTSSRSTINRAIRAECPGGAVALNALEAWHGTCKRLGWGDKHSDSLPVHVRAYRDILEIVDAMEDRIREIYSIPPRSERDDLHR